MITGNITFIINEMFQSFVKNLFKSVLPYPLSNRNFFTSLGTKIYILKSNKLYAKKIPFRFSQLRKHLILLCSTSRRF